MMTDFGVDRAGASLACNFNRSPHVRPAAPSAPMVRKSRRDTPLQSVPCLALGMVHMRSSPRKGNAVGGASILLQPHAGLQGEPLVICKSCNHADLVGAGLV